MRTRKPLREHELHVLLALSTGDLHGLEIQRAVLSASAGAVRLWPGKLYGTLRDLQERKWVKEVEAPADATVAGGRPRWFRLTAGGRKALTAELDYWAGLVEQGRRDGLLEVSS